MAARDILTLDSVLAPRLIRLLYAIALILIALMVAWGIARGVRVMTRPAPPPMAVTGQAAPGAVPSAQGMMNPGMMNPGMRGEGRRMMMMRERMDGMRRPGPFGMGRNPVLRGLWIMLGALLRGAIALMLVRVLAEIGLAVLAMPRRSEI